MENLFENKYIRTKEYYGEFYLYFHFKRPKLIVVNILFLLGFIAGLLFAFSAHSVSPQSYITLIVVPVLMWILMIFRYTKGKKISCERELELNNGQPGESNFMVTEDGIDVYDIASESKNHINFSQIKKIIKTRNFYILLTKAKLGCVFKKDSFVKGTPDEFLAFLRAKGFKC